LHLHVWEDDKPPKYIPTEDAYTILDYSHWNAFEEGDQIQYLKDMGTAVYIVIHVEPTWDGEREMRIVTLKDGR
jgi:hypothetical protein